MSIVDFLVPSKLRETQRILEITRGLHKTGHFPNCDHRCVEIQREYGFKGVHEGMTYEFFI